MCILLLNKKFVSQFIPLINNYCANTVPGFLSSKWIHVCFQLAKKKLSKNVYLNLKHSPIWLSRLSWWFPSKTDSSFLLRRTVILRIKRARLSFPRYLYLSFLIFLWCVRESSKYVKGINEYVLHFQRCDYIIRGWTQIIFEP